jgi:Bacterial pre-peptidase C-terminal domain
MNASSTANTTPHFSGLLMRNADRNLNQAKLIKANGALRGRVDLRNKFDLFKFRLSSQSQVNAVLSGLKSNADLALFQGKTLLAQSTRSGRQTEAIDLTLQPGTYFLRVAARSGRSVYSLQLATVASGGVLPITPSQSFYSDEFGYERLPTNPDELIFLDAQVSSFLGDEPTFYNALSVQYPSIATTLYINAIALTSTRESAEFTNGRPDRLFVNSRNETVFIPGFSGLFGSQPSSETIYFPRWFS